MITCVHSAPPAAASSPDRARRSRSRKLRPSSGHDANALMGRGRRSRWVAHAPIGSGILFSRCPRSGSGLDAGALRADEMESCPQRHLLTRNLGQAYGAGPDVLELRLERGDRLLLCSDGLYGGASLGSIRRALGSRDAPARIARRLVELALRGEAADNISAIVLAVDDGRAPAAKRRRSSRSPVRPRG